MRQENEKAEEQEQGDLSPLQTNDFFLSASLGQGIFIIILMFMSSSLMHTGLHVRSV